MPEAERCSFTAISGVTGEAALMPYLPVTLGFENRSVVETGLVDTGATVSAMPYRSKLLVCAEARAPVNLSVTR